eukprot:356140-Chlamydomonas_euryale.AAC.1
MPIIKSLSNAAGSNAGDDSRKKMGAFLTMAQFQASVHSSNLFLTAAAQVRGAGDGALSSGQGRAGSGAAAAAAGRLSFSSSSRAAVAAAPASAPASTAAVIQQRYQQQQPQLQAPNSEGSARALLEMLRQLSHCSSAFVDWNVCQPWKQLAAAMATVRQLGRVTIQPWEPCGHMWPVPCGSGNRVAMRLWRPCDRGNRKNQLCCDVGYALARGCLPPTTTTPLPSPPLTHTPTHPYTCRPWCHVPCGSADILPPLIGILGLEP